MLHDIIPKPYRYLQILLTMLIIKKVSILLIFTITLASILASPDLGLFPFFSFIFLICLSKFSNSFSISFTHYNRIMNCGTLCMYSMGVTGTGSADPQQMLIFWRFPMFSTVYIGFEVKHLLLVHATKYGVINVSR